MFRHKKAFTLIELLLVIGIIAILASIVILAINPSLQLRKAEDAKRTAYVRELKNAILQYQIDHGFIPTGITTTATPVCKYKSIDASCINLDVLVDENYLTALQTDVLESDVNQTGYTVYQNSGGFTTVSSNYLGMSSITIEPETIGNFSIDIQLGQNQRSYIRYLDIIFDNPVDPVTITNNSLIQLTQFALDGSTGTGIMALPSYTINTNTIRYDFGVNNIGGNRNTQNGDGYYEIAIDFNNNGTFETKKYFYRIIGDVNHDAIVDSTDSSLVLASYGTTNPERDVNGDGAVNANDRTLVLRSINMQLNSSLISTLND